MLRDEVRDGILWGWSKGKNLVAYASIMQNELLGDSRFPVVSIQDVCLDDSVNSEEKAQIAAALLELTDRAVTVEITADANFYDALNAAGGNLFKQTFHFQYPERRPKERVEYTTDA